MCFENTILMLKSCFEPTILGYMAIELEFFFFLEFHFEIVFPRHDFGKKWKSCFNNTICALKIM